MIFEVLCGLLLLSNLYLLAARIRRPRWKRLGLPDPADEGWIVTGDSIKHQTGMILGRSDCEPASRYPVLSVGGVSLVVNAGWYARAVAKHAVERQGLHRLMIEAGEEDLIACHTMELLAIESNYIGNGKHGNSLKLDCTNGRANIPIPDGEAGLWKIGDKVNVTVRRT